MNLDSKKAKSSSHNEPEPLFWESELYSKSYTKNIKNKAFGYYNSPNPLNFLFFHWLNKWVRLLSKHYVEPYKLHPLPVSDQVLYWQPIFSKHVSDGLVRLEEYHTAKSIGTTNKVKKPYRSVLLRALFLTIWKRAMLLVLGLIAVNLLSMSIAILVKKLLEILNNKTFNFINTMLLLLAIITCQVADGIFLENIGFHVWRLIIILNYLFSIALFEHGTTHRRKYFNNVNGSNLLNTCNQVLHSCTPDSECSKNPMFCQALSYQPKRLNPRIYSYTIIDSYYISLVFFGIKQIIEFLANFIYGVFLLSRHVKVNLWVLYLTGSIFLVLMIIVEALNALMFKFIQYLRDYRIAKCNDIFFALSQIKKMFYDDIAINIITRARNNELAIIGIKLFLGSLNYSLFVISINVSFYIIKVYFVKSVNNAAVVTDIDTAGFMTTFYIFFRIATSMFLVPLSVNIVGRAHVSFKRMDSSITDYSPNFYISDNKFTGSIRVSNDIADKTDQIPKDAVVYYKDATFTWVNSREDLLNHKYDLYLQNVNFELKRGNMAIVTGSQGAGKSNFIKSMLGEMTLVGGSMAVVPLYTSMPIFYASQDIWLQHGTIRSNIVFGHKFEEDLYNAVLKAVELEFDISTWEKGDMRVVSDNAPSLSGGQRVRTEMARAVYAYLVFHKVNMQYNEGKCSFLMCLDSSFHGLDPYVSKTIFNNLFNVRTGVLMKGDLSVVLTSSKQTLGTCLKSSNLKQIPNPPIYNIKNETLRFYSNLQDFINENVEFTDPEEFSYLSANTNQPHQVSYLTQDMVSLCSSGSNTRLGRIEVTKKKYTNSFEKYSKEQLSGIKFNPYITYISPALVLFLSYILITAAFTVMDTVKLILSSNLSDYISKKIKDHKDGTSIDLSEIKTRTNFIFKVVIILVSFTIILSVFATFLLTISSIISSRKLHEYGLISIFKNSSSIIKIKKDISQVITLFSCDFTVFDDSAFFLPLLIFSSIQLMVNIITLFYLIPISIPFVFLSIVFSFIFILNKSVEACAKCQHGFLESFSHINNASENAISGSSIYTSFKKESGLINSFIEDRDYNLRCKFTARSIFIWPSLIFNWIFSFTCFLMFGTMIILNKYTNYNLKVGYFGLGLSMGMGIIKSFNKFSLLYSALELFMCSVNRFRYFIPPGQKVKFDKCINTHEEYIVNPSNKTITDADRKQLFKRRAVEFKAKNRRFYLLRRMFFHPKITILDVGRYLSPEHSGVELSDVCVFTSPDHNPDGMILKHVTVSAHKSEIIGMVGRTGAGKTTLLSVLQNIVAHRTGQVMLDGKDLNDIPKTVVRQIIGVLPQLPFVFKGWTVRRFLDPRKLFTDDDINRALDQCGLLNFVNELPGGKKLDTITVPEVIKSTTNRPQKSKPIAYEKEISMSKEFIRPDFDSYILSYNQLRTLWVARIVLYRHFYRMIVVDEPPEEDLMDQNSGRNDDLEVPIYELLQKYFSHCTTFVTAHDSNVLRNCSTVWVIHEGRLVRTCKTSDISQNESIAKIIEDSLSHY